MFITPLAEIEVGALQMRRDNTASADEVHDPHGPSHGENL